MRFASYDGEEAVLASGEFVPEMILLDIGQTKLNGDEVCRRIRVRATVRQPVIIVQFEWGQAADHQRPHDARFDHHMVKPVEPAIFVEILASLNNKALCLLSGE